MKPIGLSVNGVDFSDHNRSEISISYENIGSFERTIDGTKHAFFLGRKVNLSTSWDRLTENSLTTVDGGAGLQEMKAMLQGDPGPFQVLVRFDTGEIETYQMFAEEFSYELQMRRDYSNFYAVSIALSEV